MVLDHPLAADLIGMMKNLKDMVNINNSVLIYNTSLGPFYNINSYHLGRGAQEGKYENPYNPRITPPPKINNQYGLGLLSDLAPFGKFCNVEELQNFESYI